MSNWRSNGHFEQHLFPQSETNEIADIINFPLIQSYKAEEYLRQKYIDDGWSPRRISEETLSSQRSVIYWMRRHKIPIRKEDAPQQRGLRFGEKRINYQIVPSKTELATLAKMKALRAEGFSYPKIVEILNTMGLKSKSGGKWYLKTVYEVLNRGF
jgi:hypothetical protein